MENKNNEIVEKILKSKKYRHLYRPTIERTVADMASRYPKQRVEKESRKKLHQLWGAYTQNYDPSKLSRRYEEISSLPVIDICNNLLQLHTSTKERLNFYTEFYEKIFSHTGIPELIIEPGSGFNPLSYIYMDLAAGKEVKYEGFDVDHRMIDQINSILSELGVSDRVKVYTGDLISDPPRKSTLLMMLKLYPLLEHEKKKSGIEALNSWKFEFAVISFPTRSLGGLEKGMKENYSESFEQEIENQNSLKITKKIEFENEIVYIVRKERF